MLLTLLDSASRKPRIAMAADLEPAQAPLRLSISLGLLIDSRTMIVIGEASAPVAESGALRFPALHDAEGQWRALNWPGATDSVHFVAVISATNVLRAQAGGMVLLAETGSSAVPDAMRVEIEHGSFNSRVCGSR